MPAFPPRVGQVVKATRVIFLQNNAHVAVMSTSAPVSLAKGTEAEIVEVQPMHIVLNCKDGAHSAGPSAWGLKIRVAKVVWGTSFE